MGLRGFLAVIVLTLGAPLAAQEISSATRVWAAVGLASGGGGEVSGLGIIGQLVFQKAPHHALLRGSAIADCCFTDGDSDMIQEIGLLYGRAHTASFGHLAAAAGLSAGRMNLCPDRLSRDSCSFFGIPIVGEAALTGRVIGIGLQAFVTLNKKATFGGIALIIPIGWMP